MDEEMIYVIPGIGLFKPTTDERNQEVNETDTILLEPIETYQNSYVDSYRTSKSDLSSVCRPISPHSKILQTIDALNEAVVTKENIKMKDLRDLANEWDILKQGSRIGAVLKNEIPAYLKSDALKICRAVLAEVGFVLGKTIEEILPLIKFPMPFTDEDLILRDWIKYLSPATEHKKESRDRPFNAPNFDGKILGTLELEGTVVIGDMHWLYEENDFDADDSFIRSNIHLNLTEGRWYFVKGDVAKPPGSKRLAFFYDQTERRDVQVLVHDAYLTCFFDAFCEMALVAEFQVESGCAGVVPLSMRQNPDFEDIWLNRVYTCAPVSENSVFTSLGGDGTFNLYATARNGKAVMLGFEGVN